MFVLTKVKTTNPKKYCVRPNTGVVLPGGTCDVTGNDFVVSFSFSHSSSTNVELFLPEVVSLIIEVDGVVTRDPWI